MSLAVYIIMENITMRRQLRYLLGMTLLLGAIVAFIAGLASVLGTSPVTEKSLILFAGGSVSGFIGAILALRSS